MTRITDIVPDFNSSNYLASIELPPGGLLVTIAGVRKDRVRERDGSMKDKPVLYFAGGTKAAILNVTNHGTLCSLFGENIDVWAGKQVVLFSAPTTDPFGKPTMGIRIRAATSPSQTVPVAAQAAPPTTAATPMTLANASPEELQAALAAAVQKNAGSWSE